MTQFHQNSDAMGLLERDREWLLPVYARFPIVMDRGEGVYLFDTSGTRYLDMMAGLGVNALGHAHPRMLRATAEQAAKIVHLSPQYCTPYAGELAERLCALSGMQGAFFSTGGSEAVEGAIKVARAYAAEAFGAHKHRIVSLQGSYHGRTMGSLAVTGQTKYRDGFGPDLPGVDFAVRDDLASLQAAVSDDTCCILIETVLGEGGVFEVSHEFLREARRLADKHRALLILDEIQCGLGRTGDWFAFSRTGVQPDVLILGKPLGGGIPLSALMVSGNLFHALGLGKHGSTLGGSPLACRLGLEFLSVVEDENLLARGKRHRCLPARSPGGSRPRSGHRSGSARPWPDTWLGADSCGPAHRGSCAGAGPDAQFRAGKHDAVFAELFAGAGPRGHGDGDHSSAAAEGKH